MHSRWTILHSVAYVHLYLAEDTDGVLTESERKALVGVLRRWGLMHGLRGPAVDEAILETGEAYADLSADRREMFLVCANHLHAALDETDGLASVLHDLIRVAHADGEVIEEEHKVLEELRDSWDLVVNGPAIHSRGMTA